jgi:hypothetical protein
MLTPLSLPVITGLLETTRMRYAEPVAWPAGIVALIVPEFTEVIVPIFTGLANDPAAFESWAVKTFPALKFPVLLKGTLTAEPGQNPVGEIVPVAIESFEAITK